MLKELLPATLDLYVDQGDTFYKTFTIRDNNGTLVNLDGMTMEGTMRKYYNSIGSVKFSTFSLDKVGGKLTVAMPESQTSKFTSGRYVYSIKLKDSSDSINIMSGQVIVTPGASLNTEADYNFGNYNIGPYNG